MSRKWISVVLFVVAMVAQTLTPAMANASVRAGRSAAFELCVDAAVKAVDRQDQNRAPAHQRHTDCALCFACCQGAVAMPPRGHQVEAPSDSMSFVAWTNVDHTPAMSLRDHARQARAPPSAS